MTNEQKQAMIEALDNGEALHGEVEIWTTVPASQNPDLCDQVWVLTPAGRLLAETLRELEQCRKKLAWRPISEASGCASETDLLFWANDAPLLGFREGGAFRCERSMHRIEPAPTHFMAITGPVERKPR